MRPDGSGGGRKSMQAASDDDQVGGWGLGSKSPFAYLIGADVTICGPAAGHAPTLLSGMLMLGGGAFLRH
mgnify:CR=1 FL=1